MRVRDWAQVDDIYGAFQGDPFEDADEVLDYIYAMYKNHYENEAITPEVLPHEAADYILSTGSHCLVPMDFLPDIPLPSGDCNCEVLNGKIWIKAGGCEIHSPYWRRWIERNKE